MRVLITGASGVFGRDVTRRIWLRGHEIVASSRRRPENLPDGAEFVSADIRDAAAVEKAMAGCDAVVHLAWTVTPLRKREEHEEIDLGGTQNVLDAMARTGCERLVHASSVLAYGAHADNPTRLKETDPLRPAEHQIYAYNKAKAEEMITASGVSSLLIRAAVVLGRDVDNMAQHVYTTPAMIQIKGDPGRLQLLHPEDIGRFFAEAVERDWTGPVNLGAEDVLTFADIAAALEKRLFAMPAWSIKRMLNFLWRFNLAEIDPSAYESLRFMPVVDTTRLREEFDFRPAWSTAEAVRDFARASSWLMYLGKKRVELPWRIKYPETRVPYEVPAPDGAELVPAAPEGVAGEFDALVDPRFPTYTATNTSEAFPGPLTPLSLELGFRSMRAGADITAHTIGIGEPLLSHLRYRATGMFGHSLYANLSIVNEMAQNMPGYDPEAYNGLLFGGAETAAESIPKLSKRQMLRTLRRVVPRFAYYSREIGRFEAKIPELVMSTAEVADLTDERLVARMGLLHDMVAHAWGLAASASGFVGAIFGAIEKKAGTSVAVSMRGGRDQLASAGALLAVQQLASEARTDPVIGEILRTHAPTEALGKIRTEAPAFAKRFDDVIARHGHRGPWETELSNLMFADAPELLIDAVAKHASSDERTAPPTAKVKASVRAMAKIAHSFQRTRERGRDAAMLMTHQYRILARERGRRLVAAGLLNEPDDIFYLTLDQATEPPAEAKAIVARRRAERERLFSITMPTIFHGTWEPEPRDLAPLAPDEVLKGLSASPGIARGTVRILESGTSNDLQPGDVLVARLTDTGWTPLFGYAAAVVTDMGGQISHAAVVAREFGIPCVVQTNVATLRLRNGQTVEVDGAAGTVRACD